jgi:plasmid stability protein
MMHPGRPRSKAITVRNLPPDVERAIRRRAERDGVSVNRAVVTCLEEATVGRTAKVHAPINHDFDKYAGRWSKREADRFDASLREQRRIDPKDWK